MVAAVRSPICPTDEYAINDFKSGWRKQIILVKAAPHIAILTINGIKYRFININGVDIRRRPYLPSFRRIPANTIEPATGASTWAFGSQRCTEYKGIFTRKAVIVINHHIDIKVSRDGGVIKVMVIFIVMLALYIIIILAKRGKDAATVYNIKYEPACRRSG